MMDRKQFINLMQRASIGEDVLVAYQGIKMRPYAYTLKYVKGKIKHIAVLVDLTDNSVYDVELKFVEEWK